MITKENTEQRIIQSLEAIKEIMAEEMKHLQERISLMQSKLQPHEDYLQSIPTGQMDFHYGKSYAIRTLVDEIKELKINN